jgi:hypothetical protein
MNAPDPNQPSPATTPAKPSEPPVKDAIPDGKGEAPVQAKPLTFGQQLFIWSMVIIVGIVFGVGASFPLVLAPTPTIAGVAEGEVLQRSQTAERIERIINPTGGWQPVIAQPRWMENPLEAYAQDLRLARVAEARGLMPRGAALDLVEREFLATPLPGSPGRTYHDALKEHVGGLDQVKREDMRRILAERAARDALYLRSAIAPAVPRAIAGEMVGLRGDRATVAEVVLSGARFIPEVKPDDPEIPTTFERLRATRFTRPAGATVLLAWADRDALAKDLAISDADAKSWYDGHRDQFPGEPDPKDPAKAPEPKPFEAVKAEVVAKVRAERGSALARERIEVLNEAIEKEALDGDKDPARFRAAAEKAGLAVEELQLEDRTPGTVDLGRIGTVKDVMRLYGKEHDTGFVTQPLITNAGHWIVLRLGARRDPGFQELDAVRNQVAAHLAGRRAWKALLESAGTLRGELEQRGSGGLAAWAAGDEAKPWSAQLSTRQIALATRLPTPPAEADGAAGDPVFLAALALPGRPIALVAAEPAWEGDVPRVRLVQVGDLSTAPREGLAEGALADSYRNALRRFGLVIFDRELQAQLDEK